MKKKNIYTLINLAIVALVIAAPSLVSAAEGSGFTVPTNAQGIATGTASDVIWKVINWGLALVGILGVGGFAVAGILYITAAGDDGRMKTAKGLLTYSIVGVVVALLGYVAVNTIKAVIVG